MMFPLRIIVTQDLYENPSSRHQVIRGTAGASRCMHTTEWPLAAHDQQLDPHLCTVFEFRHRAVCAPVSARL
jgi:hypothetical protein